MRTNILLLEKGCQKCAMVRVHCDFSKFEDDTFIPKNEEKILLFFSSSAEGTKKFSEQFVITSVAPILKTSEGKEITEIDEILSFLGASGYWKS